MRPLNRSMNYSICSIWTFRGRRKWQPEPKILSCFLRIVLKMLKLSFEHGKPKVYVIWDLKRSDLRLRVITVTAHLIDTRSEFRPCRDAPPSPHQNRHRQRRHR